MTLSKKAQFARNLKQSREALGLSQSELAQKLHMPKSQLSHYECGINVPGDKRLQDLARALGQSPEQLLGYRRY